MFIESDKVADRQIKKLLIFDIMSVSVLTIPELAVQGAGRDGVLAIIFGSAAALLYGFFLLYVSRRVEGDYLVQVKRVFGKGGAFCVCVLYIIKLLISCWFTLVLFCGVISETVLPNTDYKVIILSFILMGCYMAVKGIGARARVSEILFFIVMIPLFLIFVVGLKNIEVTNLFPIFTAGASDVAGTSYAVLLIYSPLEFLLFVHPYITRADSSSDEGSAEGVGSVAAERGGSESRSDGKEVSGFYGDFTVKGMGKEIAVVMAVSAVLNVILFVSIVGMLGVNDAGMGFYSAVSILKMIEMPVRFINRQDALILMFWMLSVFTVISAYFYYLAKITEAAMERRSRYGYFVFYGILIFGFCTVNVVPDEAVQYFMRYMAYIGMPQSVLIPVLMMVFMKVKGLVKVKAVGR